MLRPKARWSIPKPQRKHAAPLKGEAEPVAAPPPERGPRGKHGRDERAEIGDEVGSLDEAQDEQPSVVGDDFLHAGEDDFLKSSATTHDDAGSDHLRNGRPEGAD